MAAGERIAPATFVIPMTTVATGSSDAFGAFKAPCAGQVVSVSFFNGATSAGNASNNFVIKLKNGTVVMASATNVTTAAVAADTAWALTLSTTAADTKFAAGDELTAAKDENGTGAAITAPCCLQVNYLPNAYYN